MDLKTRVILSYFPNSKNVILKQHRYSIVLNYRDEKNNYT